MNHNHSSSSFSSSSDQPQLRFAMVGVFREALDSSNLLFNNNISQYYESQNNSSNEPSSCILIGEYYRGLTSSAQISQQHQAQMTRQICLKIGDKVSHTNHKRTLTQGSLNFHYKVVDNKYIFVVCADSECPLRICYNFLDDLETQFKRQGFDNEGLSNSHFKPISNIIKDRMAHYNNLENDKIYKLKNQIDATKDVMISNIDKVIERGERLDVLAEKTDELQDHAFTFKTKSKKLKNTMKKRIILLALILIVIFVIIVLIAVFAGCNFPSFDRCRVSSNNNNNNNGNNN
ncbi:hypothetical protein FDP41_008067 [Naegleria fowleri]|uniref:V-SNARE coiled-coil homology domain-containing protein n=1 Tax=Naegleria fowleri TaxID=5763 RepID=A0A6A5BHY2_NAEFO|nr:uncharacterized protein FDP41_008067 [Naegleria fowleri]KAF0973640.1 hypothetical protein FDP41_008067 [Naegleria fowleri]